MDFISGEDREQTLLLPDSLEDYVNEDNPARVKIAVDASLRGKNQSGMRLMLPKVDTMYVLDLASESDRGRDEHDRITKMERVRVR